jgi:lipoate-protein ligase A
MGGDMEIMPYPFDEKVMDAVSSDGRGAMSVLSFPSTAVVIGRTSRPEAELNLDAVAADGIPVMRRRGGGCAVVLDPGNIIVSAAVPAPGIGRIRHYHAAMTGKLIDALKVLGVAGAEALGSFDITVEERKIGGSCLYRRPGLVLFSASLLSDPDIGLMDRYVKHPPREPAYRRGRSHSEFVRSLRDLGTRITARDLEAVLAAGFTDVGSGKQRPEFPEPKAMTD